MQTKLAHGSLLLCLLAITVLFGWVVQPFFAAVLWAAVIAILFSPLQRRWQPHFGERRNLLALAVLLLCTVIVILPLLLVGMTLAGEVATLYEKIQSGEIDVIGFVRRQQLPAPVETGLLHAGIDLQGLGQSFKEASMQVSSYIATKALNIGQNTAQFLISFALMLYLAYFFLRDGDGIVRIIIRALPLGEDKERLLMTRITGVIGATVRGNLVVALVQGTLGGLIFWILGVQAPLLWGTTMVIASLLPAVGAALIWGPVAIYFLATGAIWQAVVLTVVGAGVIGLVDNVLRPILVGRETKMPDYLVLLSTVGGISAFGISGFVVGPLIAALFISFWGIFIREFDPE